MALLLSEQVLKCSCVVSVCHIPLYIYESYCAPLHDPVLVMPLFPSVNFLLGSQTMAMRSRFSTMTDKGETKLNDAGADAPVEIVAMVTDAGTKRVPTPAAAPSLRLRRTEYESLYPTLSVHNPNSCLTCPSLVRRRGAGTD